ncbi:MAG: cytochrome biogenesis protein [marine bacterium B5-7]|nr:MAG: cytochrome biogenesis protein [marine bacterium B5-7]
MCGGIITTLMLGSEQTEKKSKFKALQRSFVYNLGRIFSYSIAGLLAGFLGAKSIEIFQSVNMHFILQCIAAFVLIALALNILGLFSLNKITESIGMKLWMKIQPLGRRLFPITSLWRALLFGMLWGWLPCGMVYSALILSLTLGTAFEGMLTMLFFGLGTLPGMLAAGYFSDYLNSLKRNNKFRWITASLMILIALSLLTPVYNHSQHHSEEIIEGTVHHHHP